MIRVSLKRFRCVTYVRFLFLLAIIFILPRPRRTNPLSRLLRDISHPRITLLFSNLYCIYYTCTKAPSRIARFFERNSRVYEAKYCNADRHQTIITHMYNIFTRNNNVPKTRKNMLICVDCCGRLLIFEFFRRFRMLENKNPSTENITTRLHDTKNNIVDTPFLLRRNVCGKP